MHTKIKKISLTLLFILTAHLWLFTPGVIAGDSAKALKIDSLLNLAFELEASYPDSAIAIYEQSGKMVTWQHSSHKITDY